MVPQARLTPVGPGGVLDADACVFIDDEAGGKSLPEKADGYGQVAFFECTFS
jgi:hypothetical protein